MAQQFRVWYRSENQILDRRNSRAFSRVRAFVVARMARFLHFISGLSAFLPASYHSTLFCCYIPYSVMLKLEFSSVPGG